MQTIIEMDPPKHRTFRKVASAVVHAARASPASTRSWRRARARWSIVARRARAATASATSSTRDRGRAPAAHPLRRSLGVAEDDEERDPAPDPAALRGDDPEFQRPRRTARRRFSEARPRVLPVLRQDHRRPPREPARRSRHRARERAGRRRADGADRDARLLPDRLHGRPRHHAQRDLRRHARADREPGPARAAAPRPGARRVARSRRSCAGRRRSTT